MTDLVGIRPMTLDDTDAAHDVAARAMGPPSAGVPEPLRRSWARARSHHLLATDPGGAWIAEARGQVVGVALALVREGIWGLSLLAVSAAHQDRGVGRRLLQAAWDHGAGTRAQIVLSSTSPAAMRRYARLGLALRPCVAAAGIVDRDHIPAQAQRVQEVGEAGIAVADAIGRAVRGAGHGRDLPVALATGGRLLGFEDRAFALVRGGQVALLAARDEYAARAMLWGALAIGAPGSTAGVDSLTAGQDWAIGVCLDAGLALSPDGPLFVGGEPGPMAPYIPNGAFL